MFRLVQRGEEVCKTTGTRVSGSRDRSGGPGHTDVGVTREDVTED